MISRNWTINKKYLYVALAFFCVSSNTPGHAQAPQGVKHTVPAAQTAPAARKIKKIIISGNKYVSRQAILNHIPYKPGEIFNPKKTRQLIRNLYYDLKRFKNIKLEGEYVGDTHINLHLIVEEKKLLKDVVFKGNKALTTKNIKDKVDLEEVAAVDKEELVIFAQAIKKLYLEKGYNDAKIKTDLKIKGDHATAIFTITEGKKATVKRIFFTGNKSVTAKELRNAIYTKEDWLLGFLDRSGSYLPDRLEGDKQAIEQYYQNSGYLEAKVMDVDITIAPETKHIALTFEIKEGPRYTIKEVKAPGMDIVQENYIPTQLPIRPGDLYSRAALVESIKAMEALWGNFGYIYSHIEPSIIPDETNNTISLTFNTELGKKVRLNKITIKGNRKTRDKIIRRKIVLEEGGMITKYGMEKSKNLVSSLGYFDTQDGVNWKTIRLDDDSADLELIVKEAKTGNFSFKAGLNAAESMRSPAAGFSFGGEVSDRNLFGSGVNMHLQGSWAQNHQEVSFHLGQNWLWDRPLSGAIDAYHRRPGYDFFRNVLPIHEKLSGFGVSLGAIIANKHILPIKLLMTVGVDSLHQERQPITTITDEPGRSGFQSILDTRFASGEFAWLSGIVEQDTINHPIHPSRGKRWKLTSKFGIPIDCEKKVNFYRIGFDFNWFTPLIGERDLVFRFHTFFGFAGQINDKVIPFNELFNIGGPASVRGFNYGQIGPRYLGDTIGATKAIFFNIELIAPITADLNMKAVVFYDGGAGFSTPNSDCLCDSGLLKSNNFDYRHSVGIGLRILSPMPLKVDWGFKLDPRRNRFNPSRGESGSEVHFGSSYEW